MLRRLLFILAVATPAAADIAPTAVHYELRQVAFYTGTPPLGPKSVYPILTPGVLAGVLAPPPGGNPETLLTGSTDDRVLVDNGSVWQRKALPDCDDTGGNHLNYDTGTNAFSCGTSGAAAGANTALSNLASVSINTSLIPQTGVNLGAQATPFKDLWLYGSGTFGSHSFRITGTPTGHRTITLRDTDGIIAFRDVDNIFTTNQQFQASNIQLSLSATSGHAYLCFNGLGHPCITWNTTNTPDALRINTSSAANYVLFGEGGEDGSDTALAQQTSPTFVITSENASTQERFGLRHNATQPAIEDLANTAASRRPLKLTGGSTVASAATITPTGDAFHVSGTTNIDTITIMGAGTHITLIFDGVLTVGDSTGNINLTANFTTSANDTLHLVSDGSSWFELSRAAN